MARTDAEPGERSQSVLGNWEASSVAAGISDTTGDGFGRNDAPIAGDQTSELVATIASVSIAGQAIGSVEATDFFGIIAQRILAVTIAGKRRSLVTGPDDILLDASTNDFRLVDLV